MNANDPIFEALDRLADDVETGPVGDPMPGIVRKARANRRRANALVAGGLAAVVATGFGISSVVDLPGLGREPGYADTPTTSSTPEPSTPTPSPTPEPSTPPSTPDEPAMVEHERALADVDGDGAEDRIRVWIPDVDADDAQDSAIRSEDVRIRFELATGEAVEFRREAFVPSIAGTADLDGNGSVEAVLNVTPGGDTGWLEVFTWDGDTIVQAEPAAGSPADLVADGGLYMDAYGASAALVDGRLISWILVDDTSTPLMVRVWTWQLEDDRLVATEAEQLQCLDPGQYPRPC